VQRRQTTVRAWFSTLPPSPSTLNKYDIKLTVTLPDTQTVNDNAAGLTASGSWMFEGQ
jgi:hypothetical protein